MQHIHTTTILFYFSYLIFILFNLTANTGNSQMPNEGLQFFRINMDLLKYDGAIVIRKQL